MPKIIVFDTILNTVNYKNVTDNKNLKYIIRSNNIGYYNIMYYYKPYYYIIWSDINYNKYKISPLVKYYLPVLTTNYSTDSGIYLIIKYDSITHTVLDINDTLEDIRLEII